MIGEFSTWELVTQADVIISVPVLKTHDQAEMTLSLKNLKGLESDKDKKALHKRGIFKGVADLASALKPDDGDRRAHRPGGTGAAVRNPRQDGVAAGQPRPGRRRHGRPANRRVSPPRRWAFPCSPPRRAWARWTWMRSKWRASRWRRAAAVLALLRGHACEIDGRGSCTLRAPVPAAGTRCSAWCST